MPELCVFARNQPEPVFDHPRPDRRIAGKPLRTTHEHFVAEQNDMSCGIWACEPGKWNIAFTAGKDEFFCIIEGRVRIADTAGQGAEFGPGEAGVIPAGFAGSFEVIEAVRKYYVMVERAATTGV